MKLLPIRKTLDAQEENEESSTPILVEMDGCFQLMTEEAMRHARARGKTVTPYRENLAAAPHKTRHSTRTRMSATGPATYAQMKTAAVAARQGGSRKGRGFTRAEQLRGASKGGKARWAGVSQKKRREAARKAVLARWAKSRKKGKQAS